MYDAEKMSMNSGSYHKKCFVCTTCNRNLDYLLAVDGPNAISQITLCFHVSSRPFCQEDSCKRSYQACQGAMVAWHQPRTLVEEVAQIQGKVHLRIRRQKHEHEVQADVASLHT